MCKRNFSFDLIIGKQTIRKHKLYDKCLRQMWGIVDNSLPVDVDTLSPAKRAIDRDIGFVKSLDQLEKDRLIVDKLVPGVLATLFGKDKTNHNNDDMDEDETLYLPEMIYEDPPDNTSNTNMYEDGNLNESIPTKSSHAETIHIEGNDSMRKGISDLILEYIDIFLLMSYLQKQLRLHL